MRLDGHIGSGFAAALFAISLRFLRNAQRVPSRPPEGILKPSVLSGCSVPA